MKLKFKLQYIWLYLENDASRKVAGALDKSLFNMFDPSRNKYLSACQFNLATLAAAVMTADEILKL